MYHIPPTIGVVAELTKRGHEVWYYSFNMFKEEIESAGAKFISCDEYLPKMKPEEEKKIDPCPCGSGENFDKTKKP